MAIEALPEPISAEPSAKILEWLNAQKCPEFDALRNLRADAARERKVMYEVNDWLDGLRSAAAESSKAFRADACLKNFQAWTETAHALTAANSCWPDYSAMCSILGSRVFESQTAKNILLAALKKGISLLNQKLAHVEIVTKKAFLDGGLDWSAGQHPAIIWLRQHTSKLRDATEEVGLEMDGGKVGQMFSKYGGLLPLN